MQHRTERALPLLSIYPNVIKDMAAKGINHAGMADITYIRIQTGFVCLIAILDAYSICSAIDATLTSRALAGSQITDFLDEA